VVSLVTVFGHHGQLAKAIIYCNVTNKLHSIDSIMSVVTVPKIFLLPAWKGGQSVMVCVELCTESDQWIGLVEVLTSQ